MNSAYCARNYRTQSVPHPGTISIGRCLTSITEVSWWYTSCQSGLKNWRCANLRTRENLKSWWANLRLRKSPYFRKTWFLLGIYFTKKWSLFGPYYGPFFPSLGMIFFGKLFKSTLRYLTIMCNKILESFNILENSQTFWPKSQPQPLASELLFTF